MTPISKEWIKDTFLLQNDFHVDDKLIDQVKHCLLTNYLSSLVPSFKSAHNDRFAIYITHDIDWLDPWHPYSILKSLISSYWIKPSALLNRSVFIQSVDELLALAASHQYKSIWYTGGSTDIYSRYGIRYKSGSELHRVILEKISQAKNHLGYHSSVKANQEKQFTTELNTLRQLSHETIIFHRSHFLKGDLTQRLKFMASSGIQYDMSQGQARKPGFVNGYPGTIKLHGVNCVPMMLMDNAFFFQPKKIIFKEFLSALKQLKAHNGSASICFHPENFVILPQIKQCFLEIVHICSEEGALSKTPYDTFLPTIH